MAEGTGMPAHLVRYWTAGEGGAKIGWNTSGDFLRCVRLIQEEAHLSDRVAKGLCNTLHTIATGGPPGHGSAERHSGGDDKG